MTRILPHWKVIAGNLSRYCRSVAYPKSSCRYTSSGGGVRSVQPIAKSPKYFSPGPILDNKNELITDILEALGNNQIRKGPRGDPMKALAYAKSATVISRYPKPLESGKEAQALKGVDVQSALQTQEIIDTGTCMEFKALGNDERLTAIAALGFWSGIGNLYDQHGIRKVEDLENNPYVLTHEQFARFMYHGDFYQRIPRAEVDMWEKLIDEAVKEVDPRMVSTIVGSHRRNAAFSWEVDVLFTHPEFTSTSSAGRFWGGYLVTRIVKKLKEKKLIIEDLTQGDEGDVKYMGVCKLRDPDLRTARQIDIRFHPYDQYWPAVWHWTGSRGYTSWIGEVAQDQGMTLKEYGLKVEETGEMLKFDTERAMYDFLGAEWVEPHERNW